MSEVVRRISWSGKKPPEAEMTHEWLVANGLGGYASGTVSGIIIRRFHGLLIAALPAPLGRVVMLSHVSERLRLPDGTVVTLGSDDPGFLTEFRLEDGMPVWRYQIGGIVLTKQVLLPHMQNTVHVFYRLVTTTGPGPVRLKILPAVHFRPHESRVDQPLQQDYALVAMNNRYELKGGQGLPPLRLFLHGQRGAFTLEGQIIKGVVYEIEQVRGYDAQGDLYSPGYFRVDLQPGHGAALSASTESWETMFALSPDEALRAEQERVQRLLASAGTHREARSGPAAELVIAADRFLITPSGRVEDTARAHAAGDEVRTVIAGYHWFTDWGRDTMISLEGLTLTTGRTIEAGYILRTFAHYVRDGLIPNMFPEGNKAGLYHTADATLWFFHALDRYLQATSDRDTLRLLLPVLCDIVAHHLRGTRFGIGVDPKDGLLSQGQQGYQLTWMDAKVGDWVVTPRRGKAVEINALFYNALCLLTGWLREERGDREAEPYAEHAARALDSFNRRFWYAQGGHLYDVVDGERGDDPSCRPNQIFAISLPNPVLSDDRWQSVLDVVEQRLLTPVGLRSLAPGSPDYKPRYYGDLRARDAAYHQGTVWAWLIGPFIDAWLKVHPDDHPRARRFLSGFVPHLGEACIGQISEIFDAEPPYTPRGCVAQAWSVAEVLRSFIKTAG